MSSSSSMTPEGMDNPISASHASKTTEATVKGGTKTSRQRFKPQLSCTLCRTRKLKCDRNLPCQNCTKRDLSASCTYVHAGLRGAKPSAVHKSINSSQKDVQSQIAHLEELVVSLMNKSRTGAGEAETTRHQSSDENQVLDIELKTTDEQWTEISEVKNTAESFGMINIEDNHSNYVESSHWMAILDNIACLKDSLGHDEDYLEEQKFPSKPRGPDLLVGSVRGATRTEILTALPPRSRVDRFLLLYFSELDIGGVILHRPTFQKEYEAFWSNPDGKSTTWIGMLFAILCQAAQLQIVTEKNLAGGPEEIAIKDPVELVDIFREKTVQCLVLDNYTEPGPYTVETLLLYFISEHFRSADTMFGLWMVWGLIIRAAFRLGLHRDASNFSKISVFRGEINRRIWSALVHLDLLTSCQVGLPRMIREEMYDTQEASNLEDDDFDEHVKVLPPPRDPDELTPVGYSIAKHHITAVFGRIVDQATSVRTIPYEEIMTLDKILHEVHLRTPKALIVHSVEDLKGGTVEMKNRKFTCSLTFHKACCYLHRKFFVLSKSTSTYSYPYSMKSCVDAATELMQVQIFMDEQQKPGMPLYTSRYKSSSLMAQDYLLAAMLVCLYLGHCISVPSLEENTAKIGIRVKNSREEMLQMLDGSLKIWEEASSISREAARAAEALKQMLKKVRAVNPHRPVGSSRIPNVQAVSGNNITPQTHVNHNNAYPWMQQVSAAPVSLSWATPPSFDDTSPSSGTDSVATNNYAAEVFMDDVNFPSDLDWNLWDNQFQSGAAFTQWDLSSPISIPPGDQNGNFMQWEQQQY